MIITAGKFKGRKIKCPSGKDIRPTSSKTRMGIFNVLSSNFDFNGRINVLELFAGTGLFSFELLSRDADRALLVDRSPQAVFCIKANIVNLGLAGVADVLKADVEVFIRDRNLIDFNLIFMDPPYAFNKVQDILRVLADKTARGTIVVVESDREFNDVTTEKNNLKLMKIKNWSETVVSFFVKD